MIYILDSRENTKLNNFLKASLIFACGKLVYKVEKSKVDIDRKELFLLNFSTDFITDCFDQKVSKVIIVTGKGLHSQNDKDPYISKKFGILKNSVPDFIKNNSSLMKKIKDITDAEIEDGGGGAFYVFLKKKL